MSKSNHEAFSLRLRELMKDKALSQGDLARLVGVSTATVWGWIHESVPQRRTADVLCLKLNVAKEWLLAGRGKQESFFSNPLPNPRSVDRYLAFIDSYEEAEHLGAKQEGATDAYKAVASDLRKLEKLLVKEGLTSAAKELQRLLNDYEKRISASAMKEKGLGKALARKLRGSGHL